MKKIILLICLSLLIFSCGSENKITYRLQNVTVVPDSLKQEYRGYVIELVKAASYNMTGGDYEDVDVTIIQAKITALEIFGNEELALEKYPNNEYYHSVIIHQEDMNEADRKIFDDLMLGIKYE
tara:strand:- start:986 stop:1357 length:372 start_codon:yes stop_codon:yes gene_type:complete